MYPIPTLSRNHSGHARSYGYCVLFLTRGMVLGDPRDPRAPYVRFCEIRIGSELAFVGHSGDASRRPLGPQRSGDAASSIRARGRQLCMQPLQPLCRQSIS